MKTARRLIVLGLALLAGSLSFAGAPARIRLSESAVSSSGRSTSGPQSGVAKIGSPDARTVPALAAPAVPVVLPGPILNPPALPAPAPSFNGLEPLRQALDAAGDVPDAGKFLPATTGLTGFVKEQGGSNPGGQAPLFQLSDSGKRFFDRSARSSGSDSSGAALSAASPRLPPGVVSVAVDVVRTVEDVDRLIPSKGISKQLGAKLKIHIAEMAPYRIYTYHDAKGGQFTAIDLSDKPNLIDVLPEEKSHEKKLIKKIQVWNKDLQVIVLEEGQTPDLVVGGMVTEIKSLIGHDVDFTYLVTKANSQVLEHAKRHGLGHGAAVVDLTDSGKVPVDKVLADLESWRSLPEGTVIPGNYGGPRKRKKPVVLDKIFVFAGADLKVFVRQGDDSYRLEEATAMPFTPPMARPVEPREIHAVQFLLKRGRIGAADRRLYALESGASLSNGNSPLSQLREKIEGRRLVGKLRRFVRRRQYQAAAEAWGQFGRVHSASIVRELETEVRAVLGVRFVPESLTLADPRDADTFRREMEDPPRIMKEKGIRATVAVYGSARLVPEAEAKKAYFGTFQRIGLGPHSPEQLKQLEEARQAVESSRYYEEARRFGEMVARFGGGSVAVVTGGGPGIMEAANRGAFTAGGPSVGHNIELPHEQAANRYQTPGLSFSYEHFATRKMNMRHWAIALAYFPGGFGTMDELFEVLTLMQTGKMSRVPIVLVGRRDYWEKVLDFEAFARMGLVSKGDLGLFKFVETADQAWAVVSDSLKSRR